LLWVTKENHIGHAALSGITFASEDSLYAAYQPHGDYRTDGRLEAAVDGSEYPMVAWSASRATNYDQVFAISLPAGSGFGVAEQVGTPTDAFLPTTTADGNGDLWVAWGTYSIEGMYFFHTYVNVTTSVLQVSGSGTSRLVRWTLSSPAPESWWAILRSINGGPFEVAGRAQAGESTLMAFTDDSPASGMVRYRVRRECTDTRYQWLSPIRYWNQQKPRIEMLEAGARLASDRLEFAISDAAPGPVHVRVFDVQGRVVWSTRQEASQERITLRFDAATRPIPSGLYFAIVEDSLNRTSDAIRVVVIR
jgi:hypothetical protein